MVSSLDADDQPKKKKKSTTLTTYKSRMQLKVFSVIASCVTAFIFLYIPKEVMDPLTERLSQVPAAAVRLGVSFPIMFILRWVIFAQDHLANGSSLSAKFFRHYYPSSYAKAKHEVAATAANRRWFDLYNQWHSPDHPRHDKYKTNSHRSYSLRMIFYLTRIFAIFSVLAVITTILSYWPLQESDFKRLLPARIAGVIFSLLLAVWLMMSNKIKPVHTQEYYDAYDATGAYHKYKEYQGILWEIFEEEVLSPRQEQK